MAQQYHFKIVMCGDEACGKTSLILRYIDNVFRDNYIPTLGVNFMTKDLKTMQPETRLIIWDIGGQATWKTKLNFYLAGTDGAIIVFDLTRPNTFLGVEEWMKKIQAIAGPNTPFIVVGNKNDLKDLRKVSKKEVEKFLQKQKFSTYFESSAKTGENVNILFDRIAKEIIKVKGK
jgi:small GTP-binding protein